MKIVLLVVGIFVLLAGAQVLVPLAIVLVLAYGAYWLVRMVVLAFNEPPRSGRLGGEPARVRDRVAAWR